MGACSSKASIVDAPGAVHVAVAIDASGSSGSVDASGSSISVDASGSSISLAPVPEEVVSSPVVVDEPSSPDSTIISAPDTLIQKVDVVLASPKTNESGKTIEPAKPVFGAPMSRASSS